jgi:hypothetical protein
MGVIGCGLAEFFDINAGRKGLAASGENQHPDIVIGLHLGDGRGEFGPDLIVYSVSRIWTVKCDDGDIIFFFENNAFVCHNIPPY